VRQVKVRAPLACHVTHAKSAINRRPHLVLPSPVQIRLPVCLGPSGRDLAAASPLPPTRGHARPSTAAAMPARFLAASGPVAAAVMLPSRVKTLARCIRIVHNVFHDEVSSRMRRRPRRELFVTFCTGVH
jgi:hypothetical protein